MDADEKPKAAEAHQPVWIDAVRVGVPLLWFIFAVVAFERLLPLAQTVLKEGGINSIKVGIIELQLEHISAKTGADPVEIAKEAVLISPISGNRFQVVLRECPKIPRAPRSFGSMITIPIRM